MDNETKWIASLTPSQAMQFIQQLTFLHGDKVDMWVKLSKDYNDTPDIAGITPDFISAVDVPHSPPQPPIWFGVYPGSLTYLVGETGVGKSTILYNIAIHAAMNAQLWDVGVSDDQFDGETFGGVKKPLTVMYLDPENAGDWERGEGGNCWRKLERMTGDYIPINLFFHDSRGLNLSLPEHAEWLRDRIMQHEADLLIIDPIINLFNTVNENDNSEAAAQMKMLHALSRETGVAIIACHHTGKSEFQGGGNYGRGASSRLAYADVGIVVRSKQDENDEDDYQSGNKRERNDVVRFQIVKDRLGAFGKSSIYLQCIGGDSFARCTSSEWKVSCVDDGDYANSGCTEILRFIGNSTKSRKEIISEMVAQGFGRARIDKSIKYLQDNKVVERRMDGSQITIRRVQQ
jgi:hypothetical protein